MQQTTLPTFKNLKERMESVVKLNPQDPLGNDSLLELLGTEFSPRVITFILRKVNAEYEETLMMCASIATNELFIYDSDVQKEAVCAISRSTVHSSAYIYLQHVLKDTPHESVREFTKTVLRRYKKVIFKVPFGLPRNEALAEYRSYKETNL